MAGKNTAAFRIYKDRMTVGNAVDTFVQAKRDSRRSGLLRYKRLIASPRSSYGIGI
jgi:hypothetical protein